MKNLEVKTQKINDLLTLQINLVELEKTLKTEPIKPICKIEPIKKRSPINKQIINNKPYVRCQDFKRDRTEELVKKYYSKKYLSEKQRIYDTLKVRYINYEKRTNKDTSCVRRMKLIENLIV